MCNTMCCYSICFIQTVSLGKKYMWAFNQQIQTNFSSLVKCAPGERKDYFTSMKSGWAKNIKSCCPLFTQMPLDLIVEKDHVQIGFHLHSGRTVSEKSPEWLKLRCEQSDVETGERAPKAWIWQGGALDHNMCIIKHSNTALNVVVRYQLKDAARWLTY